MDLYRFPSEGWNVLNSHLLRAQNPVAVFANGIGDHLLTLPALRALSALFPHRLALICKSGASQNFFSDLHLRTTYEVDMYTIPEGKMFDVEAVKEGVKDCDLLLSLNPWHTTAIDHLLEYASSAASIGFFPAFQIIVNRHHNTHAMDMAFDVPLQLAPSLRLADFAGPPVFPPQSMQWATMMRNSVPSGKRILVVHPETLPKKMWPLDRFGYLLDIFLDHHPEFIVFIISKDQLQTDIGRKPGHIISLYGLPLPSCLSFVSQADLFLGIDSCMLHAADLFNVPGVGLFGPTKYTEFGFRFSRHRYVYGNGNMNQI